ncbi:hypothetical protein AX15_006664 [Amanita polypyramis BW_CC]|nr:hypothetical protein AX15_006664 [Amanita polypyramis BW_CC]
MTATLNYNIRWIEQTFHSRSATEALLRPEHESGNITTNDYELAIRFLPGPHRHYRVLGGMVAVPIIYAFRTPVWSTFRLYATLTAGSFVGFMVGHTISVKKHFNFVRSLENPIGFSGALENVQRNTGAIMPPSPVIVRRLSHANQQHDTDSVDDLKEVTVQTVKPTPLTPKLTSKWEQIRSLNARPNPLSPWEVIRQKQEKAQLPKSGISVVNTEGNDQPHLYPKDRAADQAEFDAMLERERQMSAVRSDNYTEV